MLHTLTMHYDIGKSEIKDLVGVLGSHPYTILAVLRVFGRGIEALPSKDHWPVCTMGHEKNSHTLLRGNKCAAIVKSSPVNYVQDTTLWRDSSAKTCFYIDHTEQELSLERFKYGMSQQLGKGSKRPFGDLHERCEFLCILEHQHDPEYKMEPEHPEKHSELPRIESQGREYDRCCCCRYASATTST